MISGNLIVLLSRSCTCFAVVSYFGAVSVLTFRFRFLAQFTLLAAVLHTVYFGLLFRFGFLRS